MGVKDFIESKIDNHQHVLAAPNGAANHAAATPGQPPSMAQIFTNRLNKGVNFGGMFVLERWIAPQMFPGNLASDKTAELDALKGQMDANGNDVNKVRQIFENHWIQWIGDQDWQYLKSVDVNAVRVPIGFWNVNGGQFTAGTEFEAYRGVYANSWNILKTHVIEKAAQYGIGVLVDLHALPGGANTGDHSGTSHSTGAFWTSDKYRALALNAIAAMTQELQRYENVVGIQIVNEAPTESDWTNQRTFYSSAIQKIKSIDPSRAIIISDGWNLDAWIDWVKQSDVDLAKESNSSPGTQSINVILDDHVYRTFSDADRKKPARQLVDEIGNAIPHDPFQVDVMVGEFSCVLDSNSWKLNDEKHLGDRPSIVSEFGNKQCALFNEKATAYYFWTYKFQQGSGGEWDFREMQKNNSLSTGFKPLEQRFPPNKNPDQSYYAKQYETIFNNAFSNHKRYWEAVDHNKDWQFWRFEQGFKIAWTDAQQFDAVNHSVIGRKAAWMAARLQAHVAQNGGGNMEWVFTTGFQQGLSGFLQARQQAFGN